MLHVDMLGIIGKYTILKAIHNNDCFVATEEKLGIIGKYTILKAIHNHKGHQVLKCRTCNYIFCVIIYSMITICKI